MKLEIILSTIARVLSYAISFVSVPLLLKILGNDDYGIWVTLTSLIAWIVMFDLGIGNSLKNRISQYSALNEQHKIHSEILGLFKFFVYLAILLLILFAGSIFFIPILFDHLLYALILYIPIILVFPMSMGINILQGLRLVGLQSLLGILPQSLFICYLAIALFFHIHLSLLYVSIAYVLLNILTSFLMFIISLYRVKLKWSAFLNWNKISIPREHISTSISFFILQITSLVLFSLGNYLVYNNLGASLVAKYDVVNKLFVSAIGVFNILIGVAWPEIVHQKTLLNQKKLFNLLYGLFGASCLFSLGVFVSVPLLPKFINYWTHGQIQVPPQDLIYFAFLVSIQSIAYSGAVFLNAFERIVPQIVLGVASILTMIPLCQFLFNRHYNITTVPLASGILVFPAAIVCLIYAHILIRNIKQNA